MCSLGTYYAYDAKEPDFIQAAKWWQEVEEEPTTRIFAQSYSVKNNSKTVKSGDSTAVSHFFCHLPQCYRLFLPKIEGFWAFWRRVIYGERICTNYMSQHGFLRTII